MWSRRSARHSALLLVFCLGFTQNSHGFSFAEPIDRGETEQQDAVGDLPSLPLNEEDQRSVGSFVVPNLSEAQKTEILGRFKHLDPSHLVPAGLLVDAILYYAVNENLFPNKQYLTVMDYGPHSSQYRLFIVNLETGTVLRLHAAHGTGSDPKRTGYARKFSNRVRSNMSSLGFIRTGEVYEGKHGLSLRLDGLSETNAGIRDRAVVIHGAQYVWEQNVKQGRSWGCIAVSMKASRLVINMLKGGSLIYAGRSQ